MPEQINDRCCGFSLLLLVLVRLSMNVIHFDLVLWVCKKSFIFDGLFYFVCCGYHISG